MLACSFAPLLVMASLLSAFACCLSTRAAHGVCSLNAGQVSMGKAGAGLKTVAQVAAASGSLSAQPWKSTGHISIVVGMVADGYGKD